MKKLKFRLLFLSAQLAFLTHNNRQAMKILCYLKKTNSQIMGVDFLRAKIRFREQRENEALEMLKEEIRLFPHNLNALNLLKITPYPKLYFKNTANDEFSKVLSQILNYTMVGEDRLRSLYNGAVKICEADIEGNFVEFGVAAGGSSALLAWVIKKYSRQNRFLYSFDTFTGMPEPTAMDTHAGIKAQNTGWGQGTCAAPVGSLLEVASLLGVTSIVKPVPGLFQDTLPVKRGEIGPIALLH